MLKSLSASWARVEMFCAASLACAVTLLILLNVVTRTMGAALFWVDELAIYAMVWMTFLGTSAAIHYGTSVSITMLTDNMPQRLQLITAKLVQLIVFGFSLFILWTCWRWFMPLDLARNGFDFEAFQGATFNFIYAETSITLGIKKYLVWLIMWLFAGGATLHSLAHLLGPTAQKAPAQ